MSEAYFFFTDRSSLLSPRRIQQLAITVFIAGCRGAQALNDDHAKDEKVSVPEREFLVVLGTTEELDKFFETLEVLGVGEIGCWRCLGTRVKVNKPDHVALSSPVTLLIFINNEAYIRHDRLTGWTRLIDNGPILLDDQFKLAFEGAKNIRCVN